MTYVDSSAVLAHVLAEDRHPRPALWNEKLVSSRLLEYEVWVRLHALGIAETHSGPAERIIGGTDLLELSPSVLGRALRPFPSPLRTLDALHIASMVHLRDNGERVELASYDRRMTAVAEAMGFPLYDLGN